MSVKSRDRWPPATSPFLGALVAISFLLSAPSWAQIERWDQLPPPPLAGGAGIFDSARQRMLVLGGSSGGNSLWMVSTNGPPVWSEIETQGTPPASIGSKAVLYDPLRDRLVMFGYGAPVTGPTGPAGVWVLRFDVDPPQWEALAFTGQVPHGRAHYSAIYDPLRDRMIVFGGWTGGLAFPQYSNGAWALNLSGAPAWIQLTPGGTPPIARAGHSAIYDPTGDRMVVFGGYCNTAQGIVNLDESWSLSLSGTPAWAFLTPTGPVPAGRTGHSAVLDPAGQRMIVVGGLPDAWSLRLDLGNVATWTALPAEPAGRSDHMAIHDSDNGRVLMYGGVGGSGKRTDLWELSLGAAPAWSLVSPFAESPPWNIVAGAIDLARSKAYLFGWDVPWVRTLTTDDGWEMASTMPAWRGGFAAVSDAVGDRALLVGGTSESQAYLEDVQELAFATGTWSAIAPAVRPPGRTTPFAVFDRARRRMILYGGDYFDTGVGEYVFRDDTWSLDASGIWTQLAVGTLGGRVGLTGFFDPARDRVVAYGGVDTLGGYNDVNVLPLGPGGVWSPLATQGTPPPLGTSLAFHDPGGDRMIVLVGVQVWALSLSSPPTWSQLSPAGRRPPGLGRVAIPDLARGRVIVHGFSSLNETWALKFGDPYPVEVPPVIPSSLQLAIRPNPSSGRLTLAFSPSTRERATIEAHDLQGRRVVFRDLGVVGPGPQTIGLDETGALAPGLYFVRLTHGRLAVRAKAIIVR